MYGYHMDQNEKNTWVLYCTFVKTIGSTIYKCQKTKNISFGQKKIVFMSSSSTHIKRRIILFLLFISQHISHDQMVVWPLLTNYRHMCDRRHGTCDMLIMLFFWYWYYYPYMSRESVSPVCGILNHVLKVRFKKTLNIP